MTDDRDMPPGPTDDQGQPRPAGEPTPAGEPAGAAADEGSGLASGTGPATSVDDVLRAALQKAGDQWAPRSTPSAAMETMVATLGRRRRRRRRMGELGLGGAAVVAAALVLALVLLPGQAGPVRRLAVTGQAPSKALSGSATGVAGLRATRSVRPGGPTTTVPSPHRSSAGALPGADRAALGSPTRGTSPSGVWRSGSLAPSGGSASPGYPGSSATNPAPAPAPAAVPAPATTAQEPLTPPPDPPFYPPFVPPYVPPSIPPGTTVPPSPTTSTTTVYPSPTGGATVTDADNGKTVTLVPGAHLHVVLQGSGPEKWTAPRSSNQAVLAAVSSSTDPATGDATADFVARAPGQAQVVAAENPVCSPACGIPSRAWAVTVVVRG